MKLLVLSNESLKEELLSGTVANANQITWITDISQLPHHTSAEVYIDLVFDENHITALQQLLPRLVIINSVCHTLSETNSSFVRINGWPTFLKSDTIEAGALNDDAKKKAEEVFSFFNKKLEWLPDEPGFVTPRVISMIINEAFISLNEGVSSKEEIDTAMKMGTSYPYGPFEWCEKIGLKNISQLLACLTRKQ
jgi:3-hydroxybutyryl-CoA dehydrogenase